MTSLFSPFDMKYFYLCSSFFLISVFLLFNFFYKISSLDNPIRKLLSGLTEFFLSLKPKMFNKLSGLLFLSVFSMICITNFLSVFPFNFPLSSQVSMVVTFSLGAWLSLVLFSIIKNIKGFSSHLIPEGTPLPLTVLLFLIELISTIIRPLTLMVRLVANILAGHLLMSLLSSLVFYFSTSFVFYVGLNLVELLVALIQSYIFTTMVVLYFSEV